MSAPKASVAALSSRPACGYGEIFSVGNGSNRQQHRGFWENPRPFDEIAQVCGDLAIVRRRSDRNRRAGSGRMTALGVGLTRFNGRKITMRLRDSDSPAGMV